MNYQAINKCVRHNRACILHDTRLKDRDAYLDKDLCGFIEAKNNKCYLNLIKYSCKYENLIKSVEMIWSLCKSMFFSLSSLSTLFTLLNYLQLLPQIVIKLQKILDGGETGLQSAPIRNG